MKEKWAETNGTTSQVGKVDMSKVHKIPPPTQARGGNYFPNVEVYIVNTGQRAMFYDDLIRDKIVMINFMSITAHKDFPASEHIAKIADKLDSRLGRDVTIYSITTQPEIDTIERLREFARDRGAREGWYFLHATRGSVEDVSNRMMRQKHFGDSRSAHSPRVVHFGNAGVGVWGAFAADCNVDNVVEKLSWVRNGSLPKGPLRQAGPRRQTKDGRQYSHNREV